jgi:hypothetical protein
MKVTRWQLSPFLLGMLDAQSLRKANMCSAPSNPLRSHSYRMIYSRNLDLWPFHDQVQLEAPFKAVGMTAERGRASACRPSLLNCLRTSESVRPSALAWPPNNSAEHQNNSAQFSLQIQQVTLKCMHLPSDLFSLNEYVFHWFNVWWKRMTQQTICYFRLRLTH